VTLAGGIRLNYKGIEAASLIPVIFAKKVFKKYNTCLAIGVNLVQ
jgi:hypothetical protein